MLVAIEGIQHDVEIILVDDDSEDSTWALINKLSRKDPRISGLSLSRNFGKEAAVLAGLHSSRGDAVIIMDGDGQHPPKTIPLMLEQCWLA
ncbi:MAG: glycosyltransferase [Pseudomonadota bacterium]